MSALTAHFRPSHPRARSQTQQASHTVLPEPQTPPATPGPGPKRRVSPQQRDAIRLMVMEGQTREEAAEAVGLKPDTLRKALKKQHVLQYQRDLMDELRTREGQRSYLKLTKLRDKASSEHVQMESAKWVAGVADIAPKSDKGPTVNVNVTPGYVIDLAPDQMKDITPPDAQSGAIEAESE